MNKEHYAKNHYKVGNIKFTLDSDGLEQATDYAAICGWTVYCIRNGEFTKTVSGSK